ncbi:hypothetical protein [Roseivivax jejudonensis]|uniref:hypothetical protein n=1 Tax=Roseivivax jejudonensis TaxID=1529041 RepID=UPI000A26DF4C|nr:hypothetical protein [Roseivivax jejudonensis]
MADEAKYPTRIAPYGLRIPPDLKARIQASADENARSLHAEIIHALAEKYPAPQPEGFEEMYKLLMTLPEGERERLVFEAMERAGVTQQDIDDGLVPGVQNKPSSQD